MGIQINGQTDTISSTDGSLNIGGTVTVNVTGDATGLTGTPNITVGVVTASSAIISGDLTVNGTTTTLDTTLTEVDKLEVGANNSTVGVAITQSGTGDILRLYDGATEVFSVIDGGKVGINKENPSAALSAYHATNNTVGIFESGDSVARVTFLDPGGQAHVGNEGDDLVLAVTSAASEALRITSSGNVGIGTDTPGNIESWSPSGTYLHVGGTTASGVIMKSNYPRLVWNEMDQGANSAIFQINMSEGQTQFQHINDDGSIKAERLRISSDGNIGINRTNPSEKLEIFGGDLLISNDLTDGNSNDCQIKFEYNGHQYAKIVGNGRDSSGYGDIDFYTSTGSGVSNLTQKMTIRADGRVGINRISPSFMLDIIGNSATGANCIRIVDGAETGHGSHPAKIVAGGTYYQEMQMHSRRFAVHTYDGSNIDERFRVHQNGNVGISSATPNDLLDVNGGSICKTGTGSNYSPHVIVRDKNGRIRYFEYFFTCTKSSAFNTATDAYILDITNIGTFFQASFELVYGTRLQSVTQTVTQTNTKTFGVNRFNSGNVAVTDENDISVDSNSNTYADVTMDALSASGVRLKVAFSSTLGPSSFCSGVLRAWGVADVLEHESYQTLTFYNGV